MKRFKLEVQALLLILILTGAAYAQPTPRTPFPDADGNRIVLKETLRQSGPDWSDYGKTVYEYDAAGYNTSFRDYQRSEGTWRVAYEVTFAYDAVGRMIENVGRYGAWLIHDDQDHRYTRVYDDHGRLSEERIYSPDGESWKIGSRTLFAYDDQGRELTKIRQQALWDGTWQPWTEVQTTYDDVAGTVTEILKHADESNEMEMLSRTITTRDGDEYTVLSQTYRGSNQWENLTLRTSTVDDTGKEVAWSNAYWLNGAWAHNYRFRTLPTDAPDLILTVNESFDGTDWKPTLRTTTTLGPDGFPEIEAEEELDQDEWRNRIRAVYTYEQLTPTTTEHEGVIAGGFTLQGNYPNPFNPSTTLRFDIQRADHVNIAVFDVAGRLIAELINGALPPGIHEATFDAANLPSGVYVARMTVGGHFWARSMVLAK